MQLFGYLGLINKLHINPYIADIGMGEGAKKYTEQLKSFQPNRRDMDFNIGT